MHLIKPDLDSVYKFPLPIFFLKDGCNWLKIASVEAWNLKSIKSSLTFRKYHSHLLFDCFLCPCREAAVTLEGKWHCDFLPLFHCVAFQAASLRDTQAHDVWRAETYKALWNPNCMLGHGQASFPHWHAVVSQVCLSRDFLAQQYVPMPSSSFICSMDNEVSPLKSEVDSKACSRHLEESSPELWDPSCFTTVSFSTLSSLARTHFLQFQRVMLRRQALPSKSPALALRKEISPIHTCSVSWWQEEL